MIKGWKAEKGILRCTKNNMIKYLEEAGFREYKFRFYGAIPSFAVNIFPILDKTESFFSNIPLFNKMLALQFITATKKPNNL